MMFLMFELYYSMSQVGIKKRDENGSKIEIHEY